MDKQTARPFEPDNSSPLPQILPPDGRGELMTLPQLLNACSSPLGLGGGGLVLGSSRRSCHALLGGFSSNRNAITSSSGSYRISKPSFSASFNMGRLSGSAVPTISTVPRERQYSIIFLIRSDPSPSPFIFSLTNTANSACRLSASVQVRTVPRVSSPFPSSFGAEAIKTISRS